MKKRLFFSLLLCCLIFRSAIGQVDTSFIYNQSMPYGTLDLRLRKSATNFYYLEQNKTFSYRTVNGERTNTYLHMTAWDSQPYLEGQLREQFPSTNRFVMNYRLLLPEGYRPDIKYPIVIFMHGLMEAGNCNTSTCIHANHDYDPNTNVPPAPLSPTSKLYNNDYQMLHGGRDFLNARNRAGDVLVGDPALHPRGWPGLVLFPQSNEEWSPSEVENAIRLLRLITKKYNVDPNRVYINGLSRGGYGAFEAIKRAPWLFAAGIMFSPVADANITTQGLVPTVRHVPVWIFQGGKDNLPTQQATEERIRRMRSGGMSVRYTLYPNLGHGTWNTAMNEPDFFSWMLQFRNTKIHQYGGGESICSSSTEDALTLYLPPGYKEYEWQRNGVTVQLGTQNSLVVQLAGNYRARFRFAHNNQWNDWSPVITITSASPPAPTFRILTSSHLPDLNNRNRATLKSDEKFPLYGWYKNGNLLDFPGEADDTLSTPSIEASQGSGLYSLRVAGYVGCFSIPSATRRIFFNGESPTTITAPGSVTASPLSPSSIKLSWSDLSDNEGGFEIWRRVSGESNTSWLLTTIADAGTEEFIDEGLLPSTVYEYKIRAVSETARSEYAPGNGSPAASGETPKDTTPPGAPANVSAEMREINGFILSWDAAIDNTYVTEYIIYVNGVATNTGTAETLFYLGDLKVNTYYSIQVAAIDSDGNTGPKSAPVTINTERTGLFYTHSTGSWLDLESIEWSEYEFSGYVDHFDLSPKTQEDYFNFRFDGYIFIRKPGAYQFRITSDDGSRIWLNGSLIADNDGIHEELTVTSALQTLAGGPHRITVDFFDDMGIDNLVVEYLGPDTNGEWRVVDADVLRSTGSVESGDLQIIVYPNPGSGGIIQVSFVGTNGERIQVRVLDAMGKIIRDYSSIEEGASHLTIPDLDVENGLYIIAVSTKDKVYTERFIIMK